MKRKILGAVDLPAGGLRRTLLMLLMAASPAVSVAGEDASDIQKKIAEQKAENERLKAQIAKLEQALKTDVCTNPEAARLVEGEKAELPPQPEKAD